MFPVYSNIQNDNKRFANAYLKVAATIAMISFPLMMGILALAEPFLLTVFGPKWQPAILLVMILSPVGMIQSLGTTNGNIYRAKGRADLQFRVGTVFTIILLISFVIGLRWGIVGVATAYAITSFGLLYPSFYIPLRLIDLKVSSLLKVLWQPFVNSTIMFVAVLGFKALLPATLPNGAVLGLSVVLGIVVYTAASWLTNRNQIEELWDTAGFNKKRQYVSG